MAPASEHEVAERQFLSGQRDEVNRQYPEAGRQWWADVQKEERRKANVSPIAPQVAGSLLSGNVTWHRVNDDVVPLVETSSGSVHVVTAKMPNPLYQELVRRKRTELGLPETVDFGYGHGANPLDFSLIAKRNELRDFEDWLTKNGVRPTLPVPAWISDPYPGSPDRLADWLRAKNPERSTSQWFSDNDWLFLGVEHLHEAIEYWDSDTVRAQAALNRAGVDAAMQFGPGIVLKGGKLIYQGGKGLYAGSAALLRTSLADGILYEISGGAGRLGGEVISDATIKRLAERLAKNGVTIDQSEAAVKILDSRGANGGFLAAKDGKTARILLRPDATRYEISHELRHYSEWLANPEAYVKRGLKYESVEFLGPNYVRLAKAESTLAAERYVFSGLLKNNFRGLTEEEIKHAQKYIASIEAQYNWSKKNAK